MNATTSNAPCRPIDAVESSLLESWRGVAEATHRFLVLLREFDLRRGWKAYGHNDCAEWLDWKCGIARVTALEKVRVAHALWELPLVSEAFSRGDLSYSKVRALCRAAAPANERDLLEFALGASAGAVEEYCRRLRNGNVELSQEDARRLHERRWLVRRLREDGSGMLTVELPREQLELVLAALESVARTLPADAGRSLFATGADALVAMAEGVLRTDRDDEGGCPPPVEIVVHVDERALRGAGGEADLPMPVVRRLCCDGALVPIVEDPEGNVTRVGRRRRAVTSRLRRALLARDRGCTFPGCHHQRYLDIHHVQHWADDGETVFKNLVTLCTYHHRLVHEGGFSVQRNDDGTYLFIGPDGRHIGGEPDLSGL